MPQPKDKDWLNGYKNKTPTYTVYKTMFQARILEWVSISSCPKEFLLKEQLLSLWEFPCVLFVVFPLLLKYLFFVFDLC